MIIYDGLPGRNADGQSSVTRQILKVMAGALQTSAPAPKVPYMNNPGATFGELAGNDRLYLENEHSAIICKILITKKKVDL